VFKAKNQISTAVLVQTQKTTMISFKKFSLFVVSCTISTDVVLGARESVNINAGGAGGGSNRRNNNAAVNNQSPTSMPPTNNSMGGSTNIASSVGSSTSNVDYNSGNNNNSGTTINTSTRPSNTGGSTTATATIPSNNSGSTTNTATRPSSNNGSSSNNNGGMNFGDHGTLSDREADVTCPICNAVPDYSYDSNVQVNVGSEMWSCGYLQETVQDVDPQSLYTDERNSCRRAQITAEEQGCCSQTMYINQAGVDFHDPCFLCGNGSVASNKLNQLVDTGVVGSHSCAGLDMVMKDHIFSANLCPTIIENAAPFCCNAGVTARSAGMGYLRGFEAGVIP